MFENIKFDQFVKIIKSSLKMIQFRFWGNAYSKVARKNACIGALWLLELLVWFIHGDKKSLLLLLLVCGAAAWDFFPISRSLAPMLRGAAGEVRGGGFARPIKICVLYWIIGDNASSERELSAASQFAPTTLAVNCIHRAAHKSGALHFSLFAQKIFK